jgi:dipeptidyl aminopeptidase/acylaminoacyl peptidase
MKRHLSIVPLFLFFVLLGDAVERRPVTFEDIMALRAVGSPVISPDGTTVIYTVRQWEPAARPGPNRETDEKDGEKGEKKDADRTPKMPRMEARTHLYRVAADGHGEPRQLTFGERGETNPQWSPDGKFISFTAARGSGEGENAPKSQIWVMPSDGGEAWPLTSAKEAVGAYAWSPDSRSIAFVMRDPLSSDEEEKRKRRDDPGVFEGDFRMSHLWTIDVASKKDKRLTEGDDFTIRGEPSWSPDARRLTFAAAATPMLRDGRVDVYIVSAEGGDAEKITSNAGPDDGPKWSPDGKTIAYTSETTGQASGDGITIPHIVNSHLTLYDVASKQSKDVSSPSFDLSPGELHWSPDSRQIAFTAGVRVYRDSWTFDIASGRYVRTTEGRTIGALSASRDGKSLAFTMETSTTPSDVYVTVGSAEPRKLTDENPQVRDFAMGETEVLRWKSTDGLEVEGILLKPVNFDSSRRYPLLVVIHGGPTGAFHDTFRLSAGDPGHHWAGQGWAVLYPNPRGSTNYGQKFMQGNIPDWGGGDYRDIMSGVDAVIKRGAADPERLAVMGWSYGGYMTCWVVSQTGRFKAAMMGAGLANLTSMYGTTDVPGYLAAFFKGTPTKATLSLYAERSGLTFADKVTTPLLILHGGNDERVPIGQPMEFYRALKDRGKTVELVFYPRAGHGLSEYYHQLDRLKRQHEWITRHTLGNGKKTTDP